MLFKALRKPINSMTVDDFHLSITPVLSSYTDTYGSWNVTDAILDASALVVPLFSWSLDYQRPYGSSVVTTETIHVTFSVSGPLTNSEMPSQSVGYTLKVKAFPTVVSINNSSATLSLDPSNSAFTGSVRTQGARKTYYLRDLVMMNGQEMEEYDDSSFIVSLDARGERSGEFSFTPQYRSRNWGDYSSFTSIGNVTYSFARKGAGSLIIDRGDYASALLVAGRYQATITVTVSTS